MNQYILYFNFSCFNQGTVLFNCDSLVLTEIMEKMHCMVPVLSEALYKWWSWLLMLLLFLCPVTLSTPSRGPVSFVCHRLGSSGSKLSEEEIQDQPLRTRGKNTAGDREKLSGMGPDWGSLHWPHESSETRTALQNPATLGQDCQAFLHSQLSVLKPGHPEKR